MNKFIKLCEYLLFLIYFVLIFFMTQKTSFLLIIPVFILIYIYIYIC